MLIVDDRQENIDALSGLIESDDVEVFRALSAEEALRHLTEHEFGLALLDVQMPETTGFELARLLRGVRRYRHLPIIFVTAHQQSQNVVFEGYETGAVDFLFKPLDPHIVRTKVRVFVELNQQRNQLQEHVAELQRLSVEAEAANIAKSQFLANMSHEIRTPLAAVMGFADLISKSDYSAEEKAEFIASVKRNGDLLLRLIEDILDLSKIEANRIELEHAPFNLREMLADVESTLSFKAESRGVKLIVNKPESMRRYLSDPARVKQVMLNVIGNAIKFSTKGTVKVSVEVNVLENATPKSLAKDRMRITVVDNGVGMTEAQAAKLFQPFVQADPSTRRRFGGSGLGLAISRQIANALGGDVRLLKTEPNAGSTFQIELVLEQADNFKAPTVVHDESDLTEKMKLLEGKHILAVDDSPDNLTLIEMYLRKTGIEVTTVEDGESAIAHVKTKKRCDLILMDVQMPGLDGHQTTRQIRKLGFEAPVIALTAHAVVSERKKCLESGCDETLTKPITRPALLRELSRFLARPKAGFASLSTK